MKSVYVTRNLPGHALEKLAKEFKVTLHKKPAPPSRKELLRNVAGKNALLCMLSDRIDSQVMDAAGPQLKIISSYSTGFEHINVEEATRRGIFVTYTADILAEATADLTFALILSCARKVVEGDRMVRRGKWKVGWMPDLLLGHQIQGSTIGIIGMGRIGSAVARRAKGFGMNVLYYNRTKKDQDLATYSDIENLLSRSDFVSIHASMASKNRHMIGMKQLRKMKRSAFLINTARGGMVNERDLILALKKGIIAGAGLDVFEKEPLPASSPLVKMKNVVILPHIGSASLQTRDKMAQIAVTCITDVLSGKRPDPYFLVNPQLY